MTRAAMPKRLRPMLARAGCLPGDQRGWAFEIKWDGVRAIAYWQAGRLRLESRNLNDITPRYPELQPIGEQLAAHRVVLDGEIVAFDERDAPSFELLQRRMHLGPERALRLAREQPVTYVIFDLLHLDGTDITGLPYSRRRELLEQLGLQGPCWQTPRHHLGDGQAFLGATARHGLEGALAKRLDSLYLPGERSGEWLKIKNVNRQELVIGGWLPGKGRRAGEIGALLVGYYEHPALERSKEAREDARTRRRTLQKPELRFAGRVGSGFDDAELRRLSRELKARARTSSPFAPGGVQPPRQARFVTPELVAEVQFSSFTQQGVLRHPIYRGLRDDKPAAQVRREVAPVELAPYRVLRETAKYAEIEAHGRKLRLSNREKALYPRTGFTKGQLIDYYASVAPVLLPHLQERPLTLKRYPDGVEGEYFYEKNCPSHRPQWVRTAPIWSERAGRKLRYCLVDDLATLLWTSNLAAIELHTSLSLAHDIERPTMLVLDLDPGAPAGLKECCRVALRIRELLDALGLHTLVKTSGSKGLQVYVPLNGPVTYEHTKPFARALAELLEKRHPSEVVSRMDKRLRKGRVLIDWSQNDEHKTTVCAYSLRAGDTPLVSTPLHWEEVQRGAGKRSAFQLSASPPRLLARVQADGDLFAPALTLRQELPALS
jgi:bifunctional non-homologous end joining protein LigD